MDKTFSRSVESSSYQVALQDALHCNQILLQVVLFISLLLVIFGGQLPWLVILGGVILVSLFFYGYKNSYAKYLKIKEFKSSLPVSEKLIKRADWVAMAIITAPFYAVCLLSVIQKLSDFGGSVNPMWFFFIQCLVVVVLWLFVYRKFALSAFQSNVVNPFWILVRRVFAGLAVIIAGVLIFAAVQKPEVNISAEGKLLLPEGYLKNKTHWYRTNSGNSFVVNAYAYKLDGSISLVDNGIIEKGKPVDFNFTLKDDELENEQFRGVLVKYDGKLLHVFKKEKKVPAQSRHWFIEIDLKDNKRNGRRLHYTQIAQNKMKWYQRLFSVIEYYGPGQNQFVITITPIEKGDKLLEVPLSKHGSSGSHKSFVKSYGKYQLYLTTIYMKAKSQMNRGRQKLTHVRHNFILPMRYLYAVLITLFICLSIAVGFQPKLMSLMCGVVILILLFCDYTMLNNRFSVIENSNCVSAYRALTAFELHNTIAFRKVAEKRLLKLLNSPVMQDKERDAFLFEHLANVWLLLHDKRVTGFELSELNQRYDTFKYNGVLFEKTDLNENTESLVLVPNSLIESSRFSFPLKVINGSGMYIISPRNDMIYHFPEMSIETLMRKPHLGEFRKNTLQKIKALEPREIYANKSLLFYYINRLISRDKIILPADVVIQKTDASPIPQVNLSNDQLLECLKLSKANQ